MFGRACRAVVVCAVVLGSGLWAAPGVAQAIDVAEYATLLNRSIEAHTAAQSAPDEARQGLLEAALQADTELIDWLDSALASDGLAALDAESRAALTTGRTRAEFNRAAALLQLGRCEEAQAGHGWLQERTRGDADLAGPLAALGEQVAACTPAMAELPEEASLPAEGTTEPPAGPTETQAAEEAVAVQASADAPASAGKPPLWHEWTLWGVGAAGIGVGVAFFLAGMDVESQLDNPPDGLVPGDPEAEQAEADSRYTIAYIAGGVGLAAAIAGTVLYFTRDSEVPGAGAAQVWLSPGGATLGLSVQF